MTTERLGAVPLAEEVITQETPPEAVSEETQWQQRVEAAEQAARTAEERARKAENDLKSLRGTRAQRQELESLVLGTNNHVRLLDRKVDALAASFGSGDTESLPDKLSAIQADQASLQSTSEYQQAWTDLSQELVEVVQDDDGNPMLNLQEAPELEDVRRLWTASHQKQDARGLQRAVTEAIKVVQRVERQRYKAAVAASKPNVKEAADASGGFDLDTGPAAGGSGMSDARWLREVYGRADFVGAKADHERAKRILDAL